MDLDEWTASILEVISHVEESHAAAKAAAEKSGTTGHSCDETVEITLDAQGSLRNLTIKPGSLADHNADTLGWSIAEAYNLTKRQWQDSQRDTIRHIR